MRVLRRLTIRARITIGTLLIAVAFSAVAVVTFRAQVEHILGTTTTTLLHHDAAPYIADVATDSTAVRAQPGRGQLVAVIDPGGKTVVSNLSADLTDKVDALVKTDGDANTVTVDDDVFRIYRASVVTDAGTWRVITARNQDSSILSLDRITQALLVGAVVLVIAFGIASWLLTSAALRPVSRMRRQSEALVAQGSTEPLPVGPAVDELSALATTLNEFISDVRRSVDRERQLVSDASHELRTPLAILMAQLELSHLASGDAVALEAEISSAEVSVGRLSSLATGLLELSQLEASPPETVSSWGDLVTELTNAVDRARMLAAARNITVDFDVPAVPTAATYRITTGNFGRVIANLTNNAISAVPDDGAVRLALRHSTAELLLTVVDSGPGMPEDFLPIAFDRFTRPDESRAKQNGGSGLGLAIVQAIATAAKGTVTLSNAAGFTVMVSLPSVR